MRRSLTTWVIACCLSATSFAQDQVKMPELPYGDTFTTEEYHLQSQGNDVFGMRFIPKDENQKHPVVIMSHGYNGDPVLFYELCNRLANNGYICYFFDFPGGSIRTRSQGNSKKMSLRTEQQNLTDIIHNIMNWDNVDKQHIFLVGESQGGIVSALTAAHEKENIKAIALMYPAFSIPIGAQHSYRKAEDVPEEQEVMNLKLGRKYYADILDMNVYQEISAFEGDVLIVHGDKDTLVPLEYSEKAMPHYKHAELKVIPGAPHGFYLPNDMKVNADYIQEFLQKQVQ